MHVEGTLKEFSIFHKNQLEQKIPIDPKEGVSILDVESTKTAQNATVMNAKAALEEIFYFNNPNRWVVEKTPIKMKRGKKGPAIPRSNHRPKYTLLTPNEIKKIIPQEHVGKSDRKSPIPHNRRRHVRTYRNARFTHKIGQSIIIPARWIGTTETTIKNKKYKIRIDL